MLKHCARTTAMLVLLALAAGCGPDPTPVQVTATPSQMMMSSAASNTWIRTHGGDEDIVVGDVIPADDDGYFIVGTMNLQFEPEMQGDIYLIRMDSAGEILWQKVYGGAGYDGGQSIAPTSDGGLIITGMTNSFSEGDWDAYLIKVDQEGNELWSRTYGGPLDEMAGGQQTADGGYILGGNIVDPNDIVTDPGSAGYGGFEGRSNICAFKIGENGDEIWSRAYDSEDNVLAAGGVQTSDGGFLALATIVYFPENGDDIYLLKLDQDGNVAWARTWEEGHTTAYDIIQTSDGNYLITGSYMPLEGADDSKESYLFIKVDPEGNEIWRSIFGDPDMIAYGVAVAETMDGGFVAVGERTRDHYTWEADIALVKIDANGGLLWERIFSAYHTMLSTVLQHPDGGYVIAGSLFTDDTFHLLLIKTDVEGNVAE